MTFIKVKQMMCKHYEHCMDCPLFEDNRDFQQWGCNVFVDERPEEAVNIVRNWHTKHDGQRLLKELRKRFEEEEHNAFADPDKGLKEHAVWNKALRILEEYV